MPRDPPGRCADVDVNRAVGTLYQARPVAHVVPVDRVIHEKALRVDHGQRPEGLVGWKPSGREALTVIMPSIERLSRAIRRRPPVHRLLRQVAGGDELGAGSPQKDAEAFLATLQSGTPAIDFR